MVNIYVSKSNKAQHYEVERIFNKLAEVDYIPFELSACIDFEKLEADGYLMEDEGTYFIEINKKLRGQALTLALIHEFVHVNQFEAGALSYDHNNELLWYGSETKHLPYFIKPHEIDAHLEELRLYKLITKTEPKGEYFEYLRNSGSAGCNVYRSGERAGMEKLSAPRSRA